jgi:hypothetical protein
MFTEECSGLLYNCREKPPTKDKTGNKDNLHLQKLRLLALLPPQLCQDPLNWHSRHQDEALVEGEMVATWALPIT